MFFDLPAPEEIMMETESAHRHEVHCSDRFLDNVYGTAAAPVGRRFESWETSGVFLKMSAASIYIPKDNPEKPRGEDAHFISMEDQTIGVADGVGGWAKIGIDSGEYARQLMMNSVLALKKESRFNVNPKRVLEEAFNNNRTGIIHRLHHHTFRRQLRAVNVGDSGFLVIRNGEVVYQSPTQQRGFNCPYQLGSTKGNPSAAVEMEFRVEAGDVIVAGTDGLMDNMHASEIVESVRRRRRGMSEKENMMAEQACYMANVALYNSFDRYAETPYSIASRKAGRCHRGGKVDDITVIIARIIQD
ncbi:putative protein phosphatase 2C 55 [Sesamum angolense]|uniref:Protein phosphatase n=1 Tax=Sesamum angolense TaxID=2727404 RepID=A0AAE2C0R4_9LAMI|nr:putative protein phosphatase 2C 55 [Sesamum angolense]